MITNNHREETYSKNGISSTTNITLRALFSGMVCSILIASSGINKVNGTEPTYFTNPASLTNLLEEDTRFKLNFILMTPDSLEPNIKRTPSWKELPSYLKLTEPQQGFIDTVLTGLRDARVNSEEAGNGIKVPTSLILGQAILESGWGNSEYMMKRNNPFGIMYSKKGKFKLKPFHSLSSGIKYHLNNLKTNPAYKGLQVSLPQYTNFSIPISHLVDNLGGYSEDPKYFTKLKEIITIYNLVEFDRLPYSIDS